MQGNLPQACCRTPREVDEADDVHSCFFPKGVFRDALNIFHKNVLHNNVERLKGATCYIYYTITLLLNIGVYCRLNVRFTNINYKEGKPYGKLKKEIRT